MASGADGETGANMNAKSSYVGQLIGSRFEVGAELGAGASGTVWVAHDRVLGIPVALKVLRSTMRARPARREAFEREARRCERMLSPHVVRMLAFGVHDGEVPYIAYELLRGDSLADRLTNGRLTIEDVETVIVQVARGLARAHALGVVHRDVKPSNVFLTIDDRERLLVKVLDFGIAGLVAARATEPDEKLYGTVEYLAPEVVLGEGEPGELADLYALAAVTYECLTGKPPFAVATTEDVVVRIALGPREPVSVAGVVGAEAAPPLDAWFRKGLALNPRARFDSPNELADSLRSALQIARKQVDARTTTPCAPPASAPIEDAHARLASGAKITALRPPRSGFSEPDPRQRSVDRSADD